MLTVLSSLLAWFVGKIPQITVPIISIPSVIMDILNTVCYFLPMDLIGNIFTFGLIVTTFRLVLALIIRVKSFIPFAGGA